MKPKFQFAGKYIQQVTEYGVTKAHNHWKYDNNGLVW